jgi:hypothetical protein
VEEDVVNRGARAWKTGHSLLNVSSDWVEVKPSSPGS